MSNYLQQQPTFDMTPINNGATPFPYPNYPHIIPSTTPQAPPNANPPTVYGQPSYMSPPTINPLPKSRKRGASKISDTQQEDDKPTAKRKSKKPGTIEQNSTIKDNISLSGVTALVNVMIHIDPQTNTKSPAVYHHEIRSFLQKAAVATIDSYDEERTAGEDPEDITARHKFSRKWRSDDWGTIDNEVLYMMERKDFEGPYDNGPKQNWVLDGKLGKFGIILDLLVDLHIMQCWTKTRIPCYVWIPCR